MRVVIDPETQVEVMVPEFATPDAVLRRERLRRAGGLRRLRFAPDWGHPWPLWLIGSEPFNASPADLGLSEELAAEIRRWHDEWLEHFDPFAGWKPGSSLDAWERRGEAIRAGLERELFDSTELVD